MTGPGGGIPPALQRICDFVNTLEYPDGADEIATPPALRAWLLQHELLEADDSVTEPDVAAGQAFREALRDLISSGSGAGAPAPASLDVLQAAVARAPLGFFLDRAALVPRVRPAGHGLERALARLLLDITTAVADDTWCRVKTCHRDTCRFAFYDESKNRSGAWCDMAVCGNREKAVRRRARARSAAPGKKAPSSPSR